MITIDEKKDMVIIVLHETEPVQWREMMLKALAAATRWYTLADEAGGLSEADKYNLYQLAALQNNISTYEHQCEATTREMWENYKKAQ